MSHCFGARCRTHQRIMESAACPEKGCPGHGFADTDCDDRCPEHPIQSFRDIYDASSMKAMAEQEYGIEIRDEDRPGPGDHALLDQLIAEHDQRKPPPDDEWLQKNGIGS